MASEMRRIAAALVGTRTESFESRYGADESRRRVEHALQTVRTSVTRVDVAWHPAAQPPRLEVRFSPGATAHLFLRLMSIAITFFILVSAWLIYAAEASPLRFLIPTFTVLVILGFPFAAMGAGSQRLADEATVTRAIRRAIVDAPPDS